ncbi:MAG: sulfurtransferase TusA family protein [Spirochaeta sp.]
MARKTETIDAPDRILDIQGDVCPYTFVKSKAAVEQLDSGQIIEIHLGNSESASNVPRSLDLEGHEVLGVEKPEAGHWVVQIKRA